MSGRLRIHGDGGSRGNPGPAAAAAVFVDEDGRVTQTFAEYMGVATNNQAEYRAVELGLAAMHEQGIHKADFFLDSQLVVRHPEMRAAFNRIQGLLEGLDVTFTHVMRADNVLADSAVNDCLDAQ